MLSNVPFPLCVYVWGAKASFHEFRLFRRVVEWRVKFLAPCFATCWTAQSFFMNLTLHEQFKLYFPPVRGEGFRLPQVIQVYVPSLGFFPKPLGGITPPWPPSTTPCPMRATRRTTTTGSWSTASRCCRSGARRSGTAGGSSALSFPPMVSNCAQELGTSDCGILISHSPVLLLCVWPFSFLAKA